MSALGAYEGHTLPLTRARCEGPNGQGTPSESPETELGAQALRIGYRSASAGGARRGEVESRDGHAKVACLARNSHRASFRAGRPSMPPTIGAGREPCRCTDGG